MLGRNPAFFSFVFPHEVPHGPCTSVKALSAFHLLTERWNARWWTWSLKGALISAWGLLGSVTSLHITCQTTHYLPASMSSLSIIKPPSAQCLPADLFDKWPLPSVHGTKTVFTCCSVQLRISPALAILEKGATEGCCGYSRWTEMCEMNEREADHFIQHQAPLQS